MYRRSIIILCFVFCFYLQDSVYGGPVRTWTSKTGKFTIQAELLSFAQGVVSLRRADGKTIKVPLAKLSKDDQNFVTNLGSSNGVPDASAIKSELGDPVVNSIGMVLVPIPAGEFQMGSPETEEGRMDNETEHLVKITKAYYLGAYEVTQEQYEKVMGNNPSDSKGENKPVEKVSWNDAVMFCQKLSEKEGVEYRLPTEAEWEYACRAGTTTTYSFGDDVSQLGDYAWYGGNSNGSRHPVGGLKPNAWGLFDMHGNVWEWCQDRYGKYEPERMLFDPTGPESGSRRVLRGGAFANRAVHVRAAFRNLDGPSYRIHYLGFRLARTYPLSP